MKMMMTVLALTIVSVSSAFADGTLVCKTAPNSRESFTSVTVTETDSNNAVLQGYVSGGIAQFILNITPVNVTIEHEVDATIYSNSVEGVVLSVVTTNIDGRLVTSATFQEGTEFPAISMTCHAQ
jgi:hypothetical protein